jgi:hypothetical protein
LIRGGPPGVSLRLFSEMPSPCNTDRSPPW